MALPPDRSNPAIAVVKGPGGGSTAVAVVFAIAALYVARDVLIPLALAVLLSFLLAPLVSWLQRRRVPRIPAVVGVVAVAFALVGGFGFIVAGQLTQLAGNLPSYQSNIEAKIQTLKSSGGPAGLFGRISEMVAELGDEFARPSQPVTPNAASPPASLGGQRADAPIAVTIAEPSSSPLQIVETVVGPLIAPLATFAIVIVVVVVALLQRQDLRDRFIRLAGAADLNRTTRALEEAGSRVAKYLGTQAIVNLSYGIPVGVGLWLIGVPNPLLWGTLAVLLRFVPYIGPIMAAAFPVALSIAVDSGWTMLLWTVVLFIVLESVISNVLEPWLYGARTGLSPIAIIVAAIFWTWLWGPIGLVLSTPLTVCLVVLGRHVPRFAFLDILLGSEPVLTREETLHQRLLALNPDEATANAEEYLETHSLEAFYGEVAIPVLLAIEQDRASGMLDGSRRGMVVEAMVTLIDNLSDVEDKPAVVAEGEAPSVVVEMRALPKAPARADAKPQVLCVGGRGNFDEVAAAILGQLVERRGIGARAVSASEVTPANLAHLDIEGIRTVCLVYLNEDSIHARYLVRRLQRRMPGIFMMVAFLSLPAGQSALSEARKAIKADLVTTSLVETLDQISAASNPVAPIATASAMVG